MSKLSFKILGKKRGGGGGTSTSSTLPEWAEPYIRNVLNSTEAAYGSGMLSGVAGLNANQQAAFGGGAELISHAGVEGTQDLIKQKARLTDVASNGGFNVNPYKQTSANMLQQASNASETGGFGLDPYKQSSAGMMGQAAEAASTGGFSLDPYKQGIQQQQQQVSNLTNSGGFLQRPMPVPLPTERGHFVNGHRTGGPMPPPIQGAATGGLLASTPQMSNPMPPPSGHYGYYVNGHRTGGQTPVPQTSTPPELSGHDQWGSTDQGLSDFLKNNTSMGGMGTIPQMSNPMPHPSAVGGQGLSGPTDNPYLQAALNQETRLGAHASSGGYNPEGVINAAVLEGQMKTADTGRQYGQAGTLGSARQAVQQGAQNAATTAAVAGIRQGAAQQNFQNKMAAEGMMGNNLQQQLGIGQQDFQNRMAGTQMQSNLLGQQFGFDQQNFQNRMAGTQMQSNLLGQQFGFDQQNFQNRMAGTQLGSSLLGQQFGFDQQNFQNRMVGEQGLGQNIAGTSQLAGNTASGLANLGNQQRTATQQQLDSAYQGINRWASTAYGNPARQQTVASGGK